MVHLDRILVPLDGSALSERALPIAVTLAQKFESEVILLRVLEMAGPTLANHYPENLWLVEAMQYAYREAQSYLDAKEAELHVRTLVREQAAAEEILLVATDEQVDLIVISSHGQGGPAPWTSGSVADKVMQHSRCPVLLVRESPVVTM
ncbi:MAG TPA: universal stress protein [Caldilineaceae bacterium]|nr:universal stress protein [Caldilineaceae bacterium]